jgi:uncharacterized membrane protein
VKSKKSHFSDALVSDDVLVERVRSQLGRAVSHPHPIHVTAKNGKVTLTGEVLCEEENDLIRSVSGVKGVTQVDNQLMAYDVPAAISSLQGGHTKHGGRSALLQSNWPPAIRLAVGTAGVISAGAGIKQGGFLGLMLGGLGTGLAALAITNQNLRHTIEQGLTTEEQIPQQRARTIPFPRTQQQTG